MVLPITIAVLARAVRDPALRHAPDRARLRPGDARLVRGHRGVAGLGRVAAHPDIVKALSPTYGLQFFGDHLGVAFISLGAIVLTITGAEALYADMGHFGAVPIRRAWFFVVFPALTLNYMGQGSLILASPEAIENPFFLLIPHWGRVPMVLLATVATVIASQAVISGAFSVTRQAVQLGFLPRLTIRHTSATEIGQVYAPAVNWILLAAVVGLVLGFALLDLARLRLRDRRHRHDHGRHAALPRRRARALAQARLAGRARRGGLLHRRLRLPRRQPDQGRARRLVPALGRGRDVRGPQHLEARQRERARGANRGGGLAALLRRGAARDGPARGRASPARRSTSTRAAKRRRWRCARASSTPARCTRPS